MNQSKGFKNHERANSRKFNVWHNESDWKHHRTTQCHCERFPACHAWHMETLCWWSHVFRCSSAHEIAKNAWYDACDLFWKGLLGKENWPPATTYPDIFAMRLCIGRFERERDGLVSWLSKIVVSYGLSRGTKKKLSTMDLHEPMTGFHHPEKTHQVANKANEQEIGHVQRSNANPCYNERNTNVYRLRETSRKGETNIV